jgi:hypothetical protein
MATEWKDNLCYVQEIGRIEDKAVIHHALLRVCDFRVA